MLFMITERICICTSTFMRRLKTALHVLRTLFFKRANKDHPEKGGALKVRFYHDKKNYLKTIRPDIAKAQNDMLKRMGCTADIEYRSFRELGLSREA